MPEKKQQHHEKYDSKNPIAQKMIQGFMNSVSNITKAIDKPITSITECGCGQGHLNRHLEELFPTVQVKGFDIDENDLNLAIEKKKSTSTDLYLKSIYDIDKQESADLVVCCEVLEHLEHPELALKKMTSLQADYYLFSVPREPIWRVLNFMRGKYMKDWGNTPDHCNHWSTRSFKHFVNTELDLIQVNTPLPWTMVLAKPKL